MGMATDFTAAQIDASVGAADAVADNFATRAPTVHATLPVARQVAPARLLAREGVPC